MITKYKQYVLLTIAFCTLCLSLKAQNFRSELGATSDNDVYIAFMKDRYYTNGLLLHLRHALKQDTSIRRSEKRILELEAGHKLYSPYSAQAPDPQRHDRPFTAYLYAGASLNWFYKNESYIRLTAQIGTIGPHAQGKEVQTSYHELLGIYKVMGWQYQLRNETGLNLSADFNKLIYRLDNRKADVIGTSSTLLGNTFSGANLGVIFRVGKFNSIDKSVSFNSLISNNTKTNDKPAKEFFFFTKPQLSYVAYDATIQGGLFTDDKGPVTFDAKPFVYSQQVGLSFSAARWSASYVVTFKSKDVESKAVPYRYASLVLLYRFNR